MVGAALASASGHAQSPTPLPASASDAAAAHVAVAGAAVAPSTAPPTVSPRAAVRVPAHRRIVLPNGVVLLLMPDREVPLIAFSAVLRGGASVDPAGKAGLAALTAGLLEKGAGARDAFQFADAVADVGGSFSAAAGAESINVSGQFLKRDRELMVGLLADALLRPRFAQDEFVTLRDREIELIRAAKDSEPMSVIGSYARAQLFAGHPYGAPVDGSERSLAALSADDVRGYWAANFGADRLTLVFAGDFDAAWLEAAVRRAFGKVGAARAPLAPLPAAAPLRGRRVLLVDSPGSVQSYFWIGNVGVSRRYPARAALDVVNTLYGGRFTSILNSELRIKSGLSYGARSGFVRGSAPGEFAITSFTQAENTARALDLALETLATLKRQGVPSDMLQSARNYVLGQFPLRLETAANWAGQLADLEFYGLDRRYIEDYGPAVAAVGADAASKVIAEAFPSTDDLVIVLVGDAAKIRDAVRKYGTLVEMPLAAPDFSPPPAP